MDNTEAIKVLEEKVDALVAMHEDLDDWMHKSKPHKNPLPTLAELERVIDKFKLRGMLQILPDDRKNFATAILDLLKGER